ncbi:MAG: 16S rRNA (guanine(966)-N(2))-methyltransferase RsmD [Burkholderiales bacterium]|nr:16S rRNA (guanine(966)-N(2))-methyltransferase RsmD [Bacteroidia bacterium]
MRIIGGTHKGKQIIAPKNLPVRPTTDFAKEGLFNILNNKIDFDGLTVLDLFCGTGNISLEFASRGAQKIYAIDKHTPCLFFLKDTAKALKLNSIITDRADVFKYLEKSHSTFDVIFADPPYELENIAAIHDLVFTHNLLNADGWLIIEHSQKTDLSAKKNYIETRKYGNVNFSFFSHSTAE